MGREEKREEGENKGGRGERRKRGEEEGRECVKYLVLCLCLFSRLDVFF